MAENETAGEEQPSGSKKKLFIIIGAVVLVLALGGVGAFLALGSSKPEDEFADMEEQHDSSEDLPAAVLPLDTFIVNLQVKGNFLKATCQLEFIEPELPPTIENEIPRIRDAIINIMSTKTSAELLNLDGKNQLREEIRDAVNETLGAEDIVEVYFTEFIIQ